MKHRYRYEGGRHMAVVEDNGARVFEQEYPTRADAIAARDELFEFGKVSEKPAAPPEEKKKPTKKRAAPKKADG